MNLISRTESETIEIGKIIGKHLKLGSVIALDGDLAAGKTYLTKGIGISLGIEEEITSPTFTIISEYSGNMYLYHMDVYRLENSDDFIEMGAEEILYGDGICVIEWSEKIKDILPKKTIYINISVNSDSSRTINIKGLDIKI